MFTPKICFNVKKLISKCPCSQPGQAQRRLAPAGKAANGGAQCRTLVPGAGPGPQGAAEGHQGGQQAHRRLHHDCSSALTGPYWRTGPCPSPPHVPAVSPHSRPASWTVLQLRLSRAFALLPWPSLRQDDSGQIIENCSLGNHPIMTTSCAESAFQDLVFFLCHTSGQSTSVMPLGWWRREAEATCELQVVARQAP